MFLFIITIKSINTATSKALDDARYPMPVTNQDNNYLGRSLSSAHNASDDISIAIGQALGCICTKGRIGIMTALIKMVK